MEPAAGSATRASRLEGEPAAPALSRGEHPPPAVQGEGVVQTRKLSTHAIPDRRAELFSFAGWETFRPV